MKRNFYLKLFFIVCSFFLCITNVSAKECTTGELRELKQLAKKIEIGYDFDEKNKYFRVNIYNLKEGLEISVGYNNYTYTTKNKGIVQLNSTYFSGYQIKLNVYANGKTNCKDEFLYTVKKNLPIYNVFSTRKECKGFETEEICRKWYDYTELSEDEFVAKITKLKNDKTNEKETFFNMTINFFIEFWYLFAIVGLIAVVIVVIKIIITNRNKKIDL